VLERQLSSLQKELMAATTEAENVGHGLAEAKAAYDRRRHERVSQRHEALVGDRRGLTERLKLLRGEVKRAEAEIKRLQKILKNLAALRDEVDELQAVRSVVEYIRTLLKAAGPHITRLLVQTVSQRAAGMYTEIMSDALGSLSWTDNYEINLDAGGRTRHFTQLSGGEQMAAALAVRLALLRELSTIDIAFFDEPTANLDETRRDNLAEHIINVRGFSQLFVISHDDTFERVTDHVVHLAKLNGQSQPQPA
jgi:exonuclease SbcC